MMRETIKRGQEIADRDEVVLCDSTPPFYFHFQVKQRNGSWADVWYEQTKTGEMVWNCNALSKEKNKSWGCMMGNKDRTKPYCSHSLSCAILLKRESFINLADHKKAEATINDQ